MCKNPQKKFTKIRPCWNHLAIGETHICNDKFDIFRERKMGWE